MFYAYKVGTAVVISSSATIVVMGDDTLTTRDGVPVKSAIDDALHAETRDAVAKRKKVKRKSPKMSKEPVATCPKCDRVFFRNQGVKQHIKHCKGRK